MFDYDELVDPTDDLPLPIDDPKDPDGDGTEGWEDPGIMGDDDDDE